MKKILMLLMVVTLSLGMFACDEADPQAITPPTINSVEVIAPYKTVYNVTEALSAEGGKLIVNLSDGKTEEIVLTDSMLSASTATHGYKTVAITYEKIDAALSFDILVVDCTASSIEGMSAAKSGDYVYVSGNFFSGSTYTFDKSLTLFSAKTVIKNPTFVIDNLDVVFNNFNIQNEYAVNNGMQTFILRGTAKVTLYNSSLTNKNTNGFGALYGMILTNDAVDGSKLTIKECSFTDTHTSVGNDVPSIIGGAGILEVDIENSKFVTTTADEIVEDTQSWAIFNVKISGKIKNTIFEGCSINTFDARGIKIDGCTFTKAKETQLVLAGEFSLLNNIFEGALKDGVRYTGIFGLKNCVKIEGNTFILADGNKKLGALRFGNAGMELDASVLSAKNNSFVGSGNFAFNYLSEEMGVIDFAANNTLSGNIVIDSSAI